MLLGRARRSRPDDRPDAYDEGLSQIPVFLRPAAAGPLSSVINGGNPVQREVACAVSLVDQHAA